MKKLIKIIIIFQLILINNIFFLFASLSPDQQSKQKRDQNTTKWFNNTNWKASLTNTEKENWKEILNECGDACFNNNEPNVQKIQTYITSEENEDKFLFPDTTKDNLRDCFATNSFNDSKFGDCMAQVELDKTEPPKSNPAICTTPPCNTAPEPATCTTPPCNTAPEPATCTTPPCNTEPTPPKKNEKECQGVELNTVVPFIGNCIEMLDKDNKHEDTTAAKLTSIHVTQETAFPILIGGVSKIVVTLILVTGFLMIVVGGTLMTMHGAEQSMATKGKELIKKVVIGIILLGLSGVILHMINPNFFQ